MLKRRGPSCTIGVSPKKSSTVKAGVIEVAPVVDGAAVIIAGSSTDDIAPDQLSTAVAAGGIAVAPVAVGEAVDMAGSSSEDIAVIHNSALRSSADVLPVMAVRAPDNSNAAVNAISPVNSPGKNRERFMINCQPLRVSCDLGAVGLHSAGVRFSFQAVVFVVYPASDKPERRHVLLIDSSGCAGLTVWGAHVPLFTFATVGSVVKFTKLGMSMHNGKKTLSMGRDTTVVFLSSAIVTDESKWWNSVASSAYRRIMDVHDEEDDSVINVAGIVGMVLSETKRVRSDNKDLMTMRLTDRSGWIDVRSWNHAESEFIAFKEKPLLLQRVRVTSFSGIKILELLDGNGTIVVSSFDGMTDLEDYWQE
jgi:hypothetical protein